MHSVFLIPSPGDGSKVLIFNKISLIQQTGIWKQFYTLMVKPQLEYVFQVGLPFLEGYISKLEKKNTKSY